MKKSLDMLNNLDINKLEQAVKDKKCPQEVYLFLEQLTEDFKLITPASHDPLKLADNQLMALTKIVFSQGDFSGFDQRSLDKLSLVNDILPKQLQNGKEGALINEFYQGIETVKVKGAEEGDIHRMVGRLISSWMDKIISALKKSDTTAVIEACTELGRFYQDIFTSRQDIKTYVGNVCRYETKEDFPFSIILELSEAVKQIRDEQKNEKNKEDILATDALSKGIVSFATLMKERYQSALSDLKVTEEKTSNAKELIHYSLPSTVEKRHKAEKIISVMNEDCTKCETHLYNIVSQEVSKLPKSGDNYKSPRGNIDINHLARDLKSGAIDKGNASHKLKASVESYQAIKKLHGTLISDEPNPIKKLEKTKEQYDTPETQNVIKSNLDHKAIRILKKIGYYLANFFTMGMLHTFGKGSPIMSPQQKFGKQTQQAFEDAYKEQIIKKPGS